jgi:hypothetical protein
VPQAITVAPLAPEPRRLKALDHVVTVIVGSWLMLGLFVDGWAHSNLHGTIETFFTPWHAIFYSGFLACALWIGRIALPHLRQGRAGLASMPRGYTLGLVGVIIFGVGGIGDMIWHIIFGIEVDIAALLSPTHLILWLGGTLILSSPFRAAWSDPDPAGDRPRLSSFLPALLSLTLSTLFATFFHMYLWVPEHGGAFMPYTHYIQIAYPSAVRILLPTSQIRELAEITITNLLLLIPTLMMLRRWRTPFGSISILLTTVLFFMDGLNSFSNWPMVVFALVAGLVADALAGRPNRTWAIHSAMAAIPLIFWTLRFVGGHLTIGLAWPPELWVGSIVLAVGSGFFLSLLAEALANVPIRRESV